MADITDQLRQAVSQAVERRRVLRLHGGDSKGFYGNPVDGDALDLRGHSGVIAYEPTELVLTARAATPLREIESLLAENGQRLTFEPPYFDGEPTLGGAIASGLAGPARPWGGAPRDHLLGVKLLDGQARVLNFGGQVMKNVAGYDVSRLMAGAQGTLGILLEISVKVLPAPPKTRTLVLEMNRDRALARMRELSRQPAPLSGAAHYDGRLYLRFSGSHASVNAWRERIGGERLAANTTFWQRLRDQQLDFFRRDQSLWRLSVGGNTPRLACERDSLLDWAGAQRWILSGIPAEEIQCQVSAFGGHVELFRRATPSAATATQSPLSPTMLRLHRELKKRFDPHAVFNRGRLFAE